MDDFKGTIAMPRMFPQPEKKGTEKIFQCLGVELEPRLSLSIHRGVEQAMKAGASELELEVIGDPEEMADQAAAELTEYRRDGSVSRLDMAIRLLSALRGLELDADGDVDENDDQEPRRRDLAAGKLAEAEMAMRLTQGPTVSHFKRR
jgi:hypothetical protein